MGYSFFCDSGIDAQKIAVAVLHLQKKRKANSAHKEDGNLLFALHYTSMQYIGLPKQWCWIHLTHLSGAAPREHICCNNLLCVSYLYINRRMKAGRYIIKEWSVNKQRYFMWWNLQNKMKPLTGPHGIFGITKLVQDVVSRVITIEWEPERQKTNLGRKDFSEERARTCLIRPIRAEIREFNFFKVQNSRSWPHLLKLFSEHL